jgi:molybdenum cofactor biosynthesis enzyme MoaA
MDPLPPPDQPTAHRPSQAGILLTLGLFAISLTTNCVQRERQADELRRQGQRLDEINAKLEQLQRHE